MTLEANKIVLGTILRHNRQWSQWLAVISATLNLFIAGICFSWSSPSLAILQGPNTPIKITNNEASWIASLMPFGSALGPIIGSTCAKQLGPKYSILASNIPYLLGFVLIIVANDPSYLLVSRFISGIGVGFGFTAVPIYVGEVAEDHNRGALMIMMTFMLGMGSLLATCVAPYVAIDTFAYISCLFPLLLFSTFVLMPDSPYYLMKIDKEEKAKKSLKWLRRQTEDDAIATELNIIRKSSAVNFSFWETLKEITHRPNPKAMFIIFTIIAAQQFCGATAVTFYQEQIYQASGIPMPAEQAVILSQVLSGVFGIGVIFFIDRWGRKPLLILSCAGCIASTAMLGAYYQLSYIQDTYPEFRWFPVVAMNLLLISFALGLAPIPYTILGEIFSSSVKELAVCVVSVGGAIESFIVTKLFQIINDEYGTAAVFYCLTITTSLLLAIIVVLLPETMHKSFLDIQNILMKKSESDTPVKETYSHQITCKV